MPNASRVLRNSNIALDTGQGIIPQSDNEPERNTYGATVTNVTPAATATDIFTITGAANRLIRVKQIIISGTATAASNIFLFLAKRSALNTGGTATTLTAVPHDSGDNAAQAVVRSYTANPSGVGTLVGLMHGGRVNLAPAANGSIDRLVWQFAWMNDKAPVLRGAAEVLAINNAGAAIPAGGALDFDILWTEEPA